MTSVENPNVKKRISMTKQNYSFFLRMIQSMTSADNLIENNNSSKKYSEHLCCGWRMLS
jgi:hypothetical protein